MRTLVQWTTASPQDWQEIDSRDWGLTAKKKEPQGNAPVVPDGGPGWVHALCVQGNVWEGYDHLAVEDLPGGEVRVVAWCDDPDDWPPGKRWARVAVIRSLAPDPQFGGAFNTAMTQEVFAENPTPFTAFGLPVRPWSEFAPPAQAIQRHGAWVDDATHARHAVVRTVHGWREWVDGVDPSLIGSDGRLVDQRRTGRYLIPKGTRTYFHASAALATPAHIATNENALILVPVAAVSESVSVGAAGLLGWTATTPVGEPSSAAWPTGLYRAQLDVTSAGVDLVFGLLLLGTNTGHFARLTSALVELEVHEQAQVAFAGAGLHLATYTGSWLPGLASDRYEIAIASIKNVGHGSQTLTLQLNEADDFTDGPWSAAAVANAALFGVNM